MSLALGLLAFPALHAAVCAYSAARGLAAMPSLVGEIRAPEVWPRVSLIIPARDEAETLEAATQSKLRSDYPDLEVVLVDDRSTDGTSELVDRLATGDSRVVPVHVKELPPGWLGKTHALEVGASRATGAFLLFSDADVHMKPDALRRAIAAAEAQRLDFLTLLPQLWSSSFILDVAISSFLRFLIVGGRLHNVPNPRSRAAVGGGVFNMVRRSAYEKTKGLSWMKLEVADDVYLGQMMKRSGARCAVIDGKESIGLYFYRSLGGLMRGMEKNAYAVLGLSVFRTALAVVLLAYAEVFPVLAVVVADAPARAVAAATLVTMAATQAFVAKRCGLPVASALVPVVGTALLLAFIVRSAVLTHARGGISWRGTFYRLDELREGKRLEPF